MWPDLVPSPVGKPEEDSVQALCNDIYQAEREHRLQVQTELDSLRHALMELLQFVAPNVMSERMKLEPDGLKTLDAQVWVQLVREAKEQGRGWWTQTEIERLRETVQRLESVQTKQQPLSERSESASQNTQAPNAQTPAETPALVSAMSEVMPATTLQPILPSLPMQPPPAFAHMFEQNSWERGSQFLALLALTGWSHQYELQEALAPIFGITPRSGAMGRLAHRLQNYELIRRKTVTLAIGKAALVELTESGRKLARLLGVKDRPSEWSLLRKLCGDEHEQQIALACLFASQTRRKGYDVIVAPATQTGVQAHISIVVEESHITLVLVEVDAVQPSLSAWRGLTAEQGYVALCAAMPETRQALSNAAIHAGIPGMATDLVTLRNDLQQTLWAEQWPAGLKLRAETDE